MPTDDDARGISVDWVEPLFRSNKTLRGLMRFGRLDGRNTLTRKSLAGGGSLKILSARAPRNLSRHDCRLLLCDEVDRYEVTTEGDALDLAERRTMAEPNRKIVIGEHADRRGHQRLSPRDSGKVRKRYSRFRASSAALITRLNG